MNIEENFFSILPDAAIKEVLNHLPPKAKAGVARVSFLWSSLVNSFVPEPIIKYTYNNKYSETKETWFLVLEHCY